MIGMIKGIAFLLVWLSVLGWAGNAQAAVALEEVAAELRRRLQSDPPAEMLKVGAIGVHSPVLLDRFYAQRGYRPAWLNSSGPLPLADSLLGALAGAHYEGLQPTHYHVTELTAALAAARHKDAYSASQLTDLDLLLTDAFLTFGTHLLSGRLSPQQLDPRWNLKPRSGDLVALLEQALQSGKIVETLGALLPLYPEYARLRAALAQYREIAQAGGWPPVSSGPNLQKGLQDPRVKELRARLRVSGDLIDRRIQYAAVETLPKQGPVDQETTLYDDGYFDETLSQAVRRFQRRHGLAVDGIVGPATLRALNVPVEGRMHQIELNMERWRWMPENLGERYILVNITNFQMKVVDAGRQIMDARAVVGTAKRPTPVFTGIMSYLVINPYWHVPRTIAVEDMLPQLRQDPYALAKQRIRIFDPGQGGQEIDPGSVDWHAVDRHNFHYRLRQDPGPDNALGRVKFMFPNRYAVYIHDTPTRQLFSRAERTYSSGCVRIAKPFDLAQYLLKNDPRWGRDAIIAATHSHRERTVPLPERIPVHLLYWTAWMDEDGTVQFRNDIYDYDKVLMRALYPR